MSWHSVVDDEMSFEKPKRALAAIVAGNEGRREVLSYTSLNKLDNTQSSCAIHL